MAQAERFYDESAFAQEFRLVSKGGEFVDWTAGVYYTDQDYDLGQNSYLVGYIPYLNCDRPGTGLRRTRPTRTSCSAATRHTRSSRCSARRRSISRMTGTSRSAAATSTTRWTSTRSSTSRSGRARTMRRRPESPPRRSATTTSCSRRTWPGTSPTTPCCMRRSRRATATRGANAVPISGKYGENPDFFTFDADSRRQLRNRLQGHVRPAVVTRRRVYYTDWQDPQLNTSTPNWGFFAAINGESAQYPGHRARACPGPLAEHLSYSLGYTYADSELTADVWQPAGNSGTSAGPVFEDNVGRDGDRLPGSAQHVFNVSLRVRHGRSTTASTLEHRAERLLPVRRRSTRWATTTASRSFNVDRQLSRQRQPGTSGVLRTPIRCFPSSYAEIDGFSALEPQRQPGAGTTGVSRCT